MDKVEEKNYYELLRVERNATVEEIKDAYHEIAKVYHPDSNFYAEIIPEHSPSDGVDMFKLITDAYNTLVNTERRAKYDETLPPEFTDWDDVSNDLYLREIYAEKALKQEEAVTSSVCRRKTANFGSAELRAKLEKERKVMQEAEQLKDCDLSWCKKIPLPVLRIDKQILTNVSFALIYLGLGIIVGSAVFVGLTVLFG